MFQISLPDSLMRAMTTDPVKHAINADTYMQLERDVEQIVNFKVRNDHQKLDRMMI